MRDFRQIRLWQTEDLPLFSGVCPVVRSPEAIQANPWRQPRLVETCIRCNGTGRWGKYGYCPCEIGQQRRQQQQET